MFSVKFILSFFTLLVKLLESRERTMAKDHESVNLTIESLIVKRELQAVEMARAKAAKQKLNDFVV